MLNIKQDFIGKTFTEHLLGAPIKALQAFDFPKAFLLTKGDSNEQRLVGSLRPNSVLRTVDRLDCSLFSGHVRLVRTLLKGLQR